MPATPDTTSARLVPSSIHRFLQPALIVSMIPNAAVSGNDQATIAFVYLVTRSAAAAFSFALLDYQSDACCMMASSVCMRIMRMSSSVLPCNLMMFSVAEMLSNWSLLSDQLLASVTASFVASLAPVMASLILSQLSTIAPGQLQMHQYQQQSHRAAT